MSVNMPTGEYLTVKSGMAITASSNWGSTLELKLPENKDFKNVTDRLAEVEKRLAILHPNEELQARFPALQEAYDHYKMIEKLVNDGNTY